MAAPSCVFMSVKLRLFRGEVCGAGAAPSPASPGRRAGRSVVLVCACVVTGWRSAGWRRRSVCERPW